MKGLKKHYFVKILFFAFAALFFSCKSLPKDMDKCIYIMIYDFENNAVKDVSIFENQEMKGKSDIYGRFIVFPENKKELKLDFEKSGYEKISVNSVYNPGEVIYIKMGSADYYAELSEKLFDERKTDAALENINKALEIESERKDFLFLKSVILKALEK